MWRPLWIRTAGVLRGMLFGVGIAFGACVAFGLSLGLLATISYSDDPSAGSIAEVGALAIPFVTPVGLIAGGVWGWFRAGRRQRQAI